MITTNDKVLWEKIWSWKDHGKSVDKVFHQTHPPGFRWLHDSFGTNWRMTEMQSAIGRLQLQKLPQWLAIRAHNARLLTEHFSPISALRIPQPPLNLKHAWYKYYVFVRPDRLKHGWNRDRILAAALEKNIPCFSGSCSEIYLEEAFVAQALGPRTRHPIAKELGETSLMFLIDPTQSEESLHHIASDFSSLMRLASA